MTTELIEIITSDRLSLGGLLFEPNGRVDTAVIWLQGLNSSVMGRADRIRRLAGLFTRRQVALLAFDSRGAGVVTNLKRGQKGKRFVAGTATERFEDCIFDILAAVMTLRRRGYKNIFLLGHSTGANKTAYYVWRTGGRGLRGVGLLAPMSDIVVFRMSLGKGYKIALAQARRMVATGRGNEFMPTKFTNGALWTARRFLSIATPGAKEDTFPYYDADIKFYWAKKLKKPLLVVFAGKDEYADKEVDKITFTFQHWLSSKMRLVKVITKARHNFEGAESKLVAQVCLWIKHVLSV